MTQLKFWHLTLLSAILMFASGCGDQSSNTSITSNFSSIYSNLLSTDCMSCHVPGGVATSDGANFDLSTEDTAYSTLTSNTFGGTSSSGCGTVSLVDAGSASTSGLMAILFDDITNSDGGFVLISCTPYSVHHSDQNISDEERTAITDWINNGAADD